MTRERQPVDRLEAGAAGRESQQHERPLKEFLRQKAERFEFSLLATEDSFTDRGPRTDGPTQFGPPIVRRRKSLKPGRHQNLLQRYKAHMRTEEDPYFDLPERQKVIVEAEGIKKVQIPSLLECRNFLHNAETESTKRHSINPIYMLGNLILNIFAALIIWLVNMFSLETIIVFCNAAGAAAFFGDPKRADQWYVLIVIDF